MTLIGDILVKMAMGKPLTPTEREKLRLIGNEVEKSSRSANVIINNPGGGGGDYRYAIVLHDISADEFNFYAVDANGFDSAVGASDSGDVIYIPAGTIEIGDNDSLSSHQYVAGAELATGSIDPLLQDGVQITGLTAGALYSIEGTGGPWNDFDTDLYTMMISNNSDHLLNVGFTRSVGSLIVYGDSVGNYDRFFFRPSSTSIWIRVNDIYHYFFDNTGSLGYSLKSATREFAVPAGVEVVGVGENSVIDGSITNLGILTNLKVTGTITGGDVRMVSNTSAQVFSRQIKSLVASGTAPLIVASPTVVTNLNADLLDGHHYVAPVSLTLKEVDNSPSGTPDTIIVPNGSLTDNGDGSFTFTPAGGGDMVGAASSIDGNIMVFDGASGKLAKDSGIAVVATINPLLAYTAITGGDYSSLTSTSFADVDATNMIITFTAPASGKVMIDMFATASPGNGTVGNYLAWGLREGTTDITGTGGIATRCATTAQVMYVGAAKVFVLSGISAGSHTYKWSYLQSAGTGIIKADTNSPAIMRVWALP